MDTVYKHGELPLPTLVEGTVRMIKGAYPAPMNIVYRKGRQEVPPENEWFLRPGKEVRAVITPRVPSQTKKPNSSAVIICAGELGGKVRDEEGERVIQFKPEGNQVLNPGFILPVAFRQSTCDEVVIMFGDDTSGNRIINPRLHLKKENAKAEKSETRGQKVNITLAENEFCNLVVLDEEGNSQAELVFTYDGLDVIISAIEEDSLTDYSD